MKDYAIKVLVMKPVVQIWTVTAENEEHARKRFADNEANFESEEMENSSECNIVGVKEI